MLAQQLSLILVIHRRILYGSENAVWRLIGAELGSDWRETQEAAFWIDNSSNLKAASEASLLLFELSTREVEPLMDERQRSVTANALRAISGARSN